MKRHLEFEPSGARGAAVDASVRAGLADSLDQLAHSVARQLAFDQPALAALTHAVRRHPVLPGAMVLYADLVPALTGGSRADAEAVLAALARPEWRQPACHHVATLTDATLGAGMADRYRRHLQDDEAQALAIEPVGPAALAEAGAAIAAARHLLAHADPGTAAESDALVNEVLLLHGEPGPGGVAFHGASSFYIWGALALDPARHGSRVKLVEGLVHEAAHGLLHGLTLGGALTENDAAQRFPSPLRDDPRPMEGLVHAAYVLARMHLAMRTVARAAPSAAEREQADQLARSAAGSFAAALPTIRRDARFNPLGAAIFGGAERFMAQALDPVQGGASP